MILAYHSGKVPHTLMPELDQLNVPRQITLPRLPHEVPLQCCSQRGLGALQRQRGELRQPRAHGVVPGCLSGAQSIGSATRGGGQKVQTKADWCDDCRVAEGGDPNESLDRGATSLIPYFRRTSQKRPTSHILRASNAWFALCEAQGLCLCATTTTQSCRQ